MKPENVKAEVYEAMAVINRGFQQITEGMMRLRKHGILAEDYVFNQQTINSAVCARINCEILKTINLREEDDRNHYGKMRTALAKRNRRKQT